MSDQEAVWNAFPGVLDAPELFSGGFLWASLTNEMKYAALTRFKRLIGIPLADGFGISTPFTLAAVPDALPRYAWDRTLALLMMVFCAAIVATFECCWRSLLC